VLARIVIEALDADQPKPPKLHVGNGIERDLQRRGEYHHVNPGAATAAMPKPAGNAPVRPIGDQLVQTRWCREPYGASPSNVVLDMYLLRCRGRYAEMFELQAAAYR